VTLHAPSVKDLLPCRAPTAATVTR
jgi:hypothetical protein